MREQQILASQQADILLDSTPARSHAAFDISAYINVLAKVMSWINKYELIKINLSSFIMEESNLINLSPTGQFLK